MSVQTQLKRFRVAPSPADPLTDAVSGFVNPLVKSIDPASGVKRYARDFMVADQDVFPGVLGEKDGSLKFVTELRGFGGATPGAGNGVQASDGENGILLKTAFGNQTKDTGNTVASSTSSIITATSGALLSVGNFVGVVDPATGLYHARQIRSKATNALTLCRALPFTPAGSAAIYASAAYTHATQGHQHLWFDVEGYDPTAANNWRRYLRGVLLDLVLKLTGDAEMEWSGKALDWTKQDGATQGAPTYPANLPAAGMLPGRQTSLYVDAAEQKAVSFEFTLGNDIQPKPATAAANGIASWFIRGAKRTAKMTVLHDDGGSTLVAKFLAGTKFDLLYGLTQGGPGNSLAIAAPFVEITAMKEKTVNGLDAYDFELQVCRNDTIPNVADVTLGIL